MKRISLLLCLILQTSLVSFAQNAKQFPFRDESLPVNDRIEDLLGRLTFEQKISLMVHDNPEIETLGIKSYNWWNEALHGVARKGLATVFPQAIALAATFDDVAVEETFSMVSDEGRAKFNEYRKNGDYNIGLSFFTPNINIFRDPRWGRGMETYGEDPFLTSRMGVACVKGLQGNDSNHLKSLACAKHLAVHSGPEGVRHEFDVSVSPYDLYMTYLPAFKALIKEADVQQVMCGYNRLEGDPCCTNEELLVNILRNEWKYDNIVVTDCWALNDCWERDTVIPRHKTHETAALAAADAFSNAVDLECGSGKQALLDALKQNLISEDIIDEHLRRILRAQFKLGIFNEKSPYSDYSEDMISSESHVNQALKMAEESIVLLKNDGVLPLKKYVKIAVIGPNAYDSTMLLANYNGTPNHSITILEGIYRHLGGAGELHIKSDDTLLNTPAGVQIYYNKACNLVDDKYVPSEDFYRNIDESKVTIFVGGLSPEVEGEELSVRADGFERGDRTRIELPKAQAEMLQYLRLDGHDPIFVICTGSAIALENVKDYPEAILCAWYGGQETGTAVAKVLFGDYNPAGRLPVTFYSSTSQLPDFKDYSMKGRTYRYMTGKPAYAFGYGLSYTEFVYDRPMYNKAKRVLSFRVRNVGAVDGDEVAQVYLTVKDEAHGLKKQLVGFKRVHIKAGKSARVKIQIPEEAFYYYDDGNGENNSAPVFKKYKNVSLMYGSSSRDRDLKLIKVM